MGRWAEMGMARYVCSQTCMFGVREVLLGRYGGVVKRWDLQLEML
jgi:hypothetical protein